MLLLHLILIERWASDALNKEAPKFHVLNKDDVVRRDAATLPAQTLTDFILGMDASLRAVNISVGFGHDQATGISWYTARLSVRRMGVLSVGTVPVSVWNRNIYGIFGSNVAPDTQMKSVIEALVREFARDWSKDNP